MSNEPTEVSLDELADDADDGYEFSDHEDEGE